MAKDPRILDQFRKPSNFSLPPGVEPRWRYHYDYSPQGQPSEPSWLEIDHRTEPRRFSETILAYILDGNVTDDGLYVTDKWKHAPWLHCGFKGREPFSGLRLGGVVDPLYISSSQVRPVQCWLNSYFNDHAASTLWKIFGDGSDVPTINQEVLKAGRGTLIFETIFCDATADEIYTVKEAPTIQAYIAGRVPESNAEPDLKARTQEPEISTLRLIQTDFAARIDGRGDEIGWVFGTFIHDGTPEQSPRDKWKHLIPVGIQWGNDPSLTQKSYDAGNLSNSYWVNTRALDIINSFKGARPWLGWHARLNGPVDDFMSTCTSCHATAQIDIRKKEERQPIPLVQPGGRKQIPEGEPRGIWVDEDPTKVTKWFTNIKAGDAWDENYLSADYNRHVHYAYENFRDWDEAGRPSVCGQ